LFFPLSDPALGTIAAFGSYGVGFLARPLGAAIFGHFGDRVGRKTMLAMTIVIMGLGTFLIGLLPTYSQIGILAPVLLVLLRLLQGIGLGGEWGGALLMVVENAPARNRGLLGSMVQLGYPVGNLAAIGALALLSQLPDPEFLAWGWRIPFLISILMAGVGLYIRMQLEETPVFREIEAKNEVARLPLVEILTAHRRMFFTAIGLKLSEISYVSVAGVFAISYVTGKLALPRTLILNALLLSSIVALAAIPLFGWLSDKVGRKTMFYASCLFAMAFAFPMFWLFDTKNALIITLTVVAAITFGQIVGFGVGAPWYSELFAARLRYTGASLGFQIGAAISGGLTPFAAATFMAWTGGATWPISIYLIMLGLITLVATMVAPETAGKPLK
jgi:MHS family shikimate/dehydroshikimate transporter-like MFS transporter